MFPHKCLLDEQQGNEINFEINCFMINKENGGYRIFQRPV